MCQPSAPLRRRRRGSKVDGEPPEEGPWGAGREVDVGDPRCGLARKPRYEEELTLPVLRVEEVLDTEKRLEVLVAVAGGPVEERVPAGGLRASRIGGAVPAGGRLHGPREPPPPPR